MQRNTGYFPTESLEPCGNRLFSRSALNEGYLFRGSLNLEQRHLLKRLSKTLSGKDRNIMESILRDFTLKEASEADPGC